MVKGGKGLLPGNPHLYLYRLTKIFTFTLEDFTLYSYLNPLANCFTFTL